MTARVEDENGFILIENNPITREGVFEYLGRSIGAEPPDKIFKVYRPRAEIEDQECIDSFKLLPIIDDHEMLGTAEQGLTDASDYGTHGTTGETVATRDGVMYATLKMFSEKIATAIKKGKKDLSLGYRCVYEKATGTFAGESYDFIQRQLRGNHLALVDEARCAVSVLDSKFTYDSIDISSRKGNQMSKENEGKDELTLETVAQAVAKLAEKVDAIAERVGENAEVEKKEIAEGDAEEEKKASDEDTNKDDEAKKAEDAEGEEKDDKTKSGNNAEGAALAAGLDARLKKLEAMDASAVVKAAMVQIGERDALAEKLSHHIGSFDCKDKTLDEVAAYGVKKLGLDSKKGQEQATLAGYLAGAKLAKAPQASAMDSARSGKPSIVDKHING